MENTKRVDILLPYWGDFDIAKQTIDSVFAQTSSQWHLTILDDHYESAEAIKYFKSLTDPRVTYIRHPENIGITNNFNACIETAAAEYCMIVGCDDILLPNYVEQALQNIGTADFYQPNVQIIDKDSQVYLPLADKVKRLLAPKKSGCYSGEKLATSLCHGNWLYFPSILWRTETLKKYRFDAKYKIVEDVVVELQMIIDGATLYVDRGNPTFQYRRFAESLSSKEKGKGGIRFGEEAAAYTEFAQKFSEIGWKKAARGAKLRITSRLHALTSG